MLNVWQNWPGVDDATLEGTPAVVKREWGDRFRKLTPGMEKIYQQVGPSEVYDSVNRLIRDGKLEVRCMYFMPRSNQYAWRVEYRLTPEGIARRDEWKRLN